MNRLLVVTAVMDLITGLHGDRGGNRHAFVPTEWMGGKMLIRGCVALAGLLLIVAGALSAVVLTLVQSGLAAAFEMATYAAMGLGLFVVIIVALGLFHVGRSILRFVGGLVGLWERGNAGWYHDSTTMRRR